MCAAACCAYDSPSYIVIICEHVFLPHYEMVFKTLINLADLFSGSHKSSLLFALYPLCLLFYFIFLKI